MTLIKERFHVEAETKPGKIGEFEVFLDGESIAKRGGNFLTRSFGGGYPDLAEVLSVLEQKSGQA